MELKQDKPQSQSAQKYYYARKQSNPQSDDKIQEKKTKTIYQPVNKGIGGSQQVCQFYLQGKCRYGMSCKKSHQAESVNNQIHQSKNMRDYQNEKTISNQISSSNPLRNKRQYVFDERLSAECKALAQLAIEEKKQGYLLKEEDEAVKHEPAIIGDKDNYNMILIRHAMSESNYLQSKYTQGVSKEKLKKFKQHFRYFLYENNNSFMDAALHPIGVKQCADISKLNTTIPYKTVFVSPLRRTMQTCIEIFKTHPDRHKINFIIYPDIAEMLKKDSDIFLSNEFNQLVEQAKNNYDIKFDTEKYYSPEWQFDHLKGNQEMKSAKTFNVQLLKSLIVQKFPQPLENFDLFQQRIKKAIKDLREIQRMTKDRTGIITHSLVAREFLTSQDMEQDEEIENLTFIYYNNK